MHFTITNAAGAPLLQRRSRSPEADRHLTVSRGGDPLYSLVIDTDGTLAIWRCDEGDTWSQLDVTPPP